MKSILPIIFVVLVLTGAITFALAKRAIPTREVNKFGIAANELPGSIDNITPTPTVKKTGFVTTTPTPFVTPKTTPSLTPTPTKAPTVMPEVTENESTSSTKKVSSTTKTTKTTKTVVCTPVYGMANTCTEHIVVDTGAADAIFFNFAGLAYVAGLTSFIKARTLKK